MKKIIINSILLLLCITTAYYTTKVYLHMSQTQHEAYTALNQKFSEQADAISKIFASLESEAATLAKIQDESQLKSTLPKNVLAIAVFDSQKNFSYGFERNGDGTLENLPPTTLPPIPFHWVRIDIESSHHACYGTYVLEKEDHSFLSITYDLIDVLNLVEGMSIGSESFATTNHISNQYTVPPFNVSEIDALSRLENAPIYFSKPITPEWTFVFAGVWSDINPFSIADLYSLLIIIALWGALLTLGTAVLFHADLAHRKALFATSILFNLSCITIISVLFLDFPTKFHQIAEQSLSFKKTTELFKSAPSAVFVPTTIYLESISFPSDSSFLVTGFIYQSYPKNSSIEKGFIFPESTILFNSRVNEITRWDDGNHIKILWQFGVTLTGSFQSSFFPFDTRELNIILWPLEAHEDVIFIPHFSDYPSLFPVAKPGIGAHVSVLGWNVTRSGFLIDNILPYKFLHTSHSISFNFSILLARAFLDTFISTFLSLILCIIVTFLVLFIPQNSILKSLFSTISIFVGLLFIVVTSHSAFRKVLSVGSFAYVEYLFVSFYIVLLTLTSYFIFNLRNINKKDDTHLILTVLYWPILLGSFTLILTATFLLT